RGEGEKSKAPGGGGARSTHGTSRAARRTSTPLHSPRVCSPTANNSRCYQAGGADTLCRRHGSARGGAPRRRRRLRVRRGGGGRSPGGGRRRGG
uniref:Uncharacterized protein n=1 Tax=Aegilops tauschii subsp. strangulata TaxID=200361 RepID=A0A453D4J6_AEGTS